MQIEAKKLQQQYPEFAQIPLDDWVKNGVAIAYVESKFNPLAKNKSSTAKGLMQILKGTKKAIENNILKKKALIGDLADAQYSAKLGLAYIAYNYNHPNYGKKNWDRTIVSYNQGHYDEAGFGYLKKVKSVFTQIDFAALQAGYDNYSSLSTFKKLFGDIGGIRSPQFVSTGTHEYYDEDITT